MNRYNEPVGDVVTLLNTKPDGACHGNYDIEIFKDDENITYMFGTKPSVYFDPTDEDDLDSVSTQLWVPKDLIIEDGEFIGECSAELKEQSDMTDSAITSAKFANEESDNAEKKMARMKEAKNGRVRTILHVGLEPDKIKKVSNGGRHYTYDVDALGCSLRVEAMRPKAIKSRMSYSVF